LYNWDQSKGNNTAASAKIFAKCEGDASSSHDFSQTPLQGVDPLVLLSLQVFYSCYHKSNLLPDRLSLAEHCSQAGDVGNCFISQNQHP
jgi:hypothetical protein